MINLVFDDDSIIETTITIPKENNANDMFAALFKFWCAATYTDESFLEKCEKAVKSNGLTLY